MNSTTRSTRNRTKYNRRAQQCGKVPKVDMHFYAKCTTQVHRTSTECQPHAHTTHTVVQVEIVQQTAETLCRITNEQQTKGVILKLHSMHVITNIISPSSPQNMTSEFGVRVRDKSTVVMSFKLSFLLVRLTRSCSAFVFFKCFSKCIIAAPLIPGMASSSSVRKAR